MQVFLEDMARKGAPDRDRDTTSTTSHEPQPQKEQAQPTSSPP